VTTEHRLGKGVAARLYPEVNAGGYSRLDGTVAFYTRVRALTGPDSTLVDFGAGRGKFLEDPVPFRRELQRLRGSVRRVIGLDVDEAVRDNNALDEAHVITGADPLPLPDASVDLVVADFVFEHVQDTIWAGREIGRILRPGGWICARTPNRFGVIAIAARTVPNRFHVAALRVLQPSKRDIDTFPTAYRMNSRRDLRTCFPPEDFDHYTYTYDSGPAYAGESWLGWSAFRILSRFTPAAMRPMLFVFVQKRCRAT
jgi:SAM-dependent methyltransferase